MTDKELRILIRITNVALFAILLVIFYPTH